MDMLKTATAKLFRAFLFVLFILFLISFPTASHNYVVKGNKIGKNKNKVLKTYEFISQIYFSIHGVV